MQRVHLEAVSEVAESAQLALELGPPDWYRQAKTPTAGASCPSWRTDPEAGAVTDRRDAAGQPLGSYVIEIDLT